MADFAEIAELFVADGLAVRATMMGQPCLKAAGALFAARTPGGALAVKLTPERVAEEIAAGHGAAFGPGATPFAKWVAVTHPSAAYGRERALEALELLAGA